MAATDPADPSADPGDGPSADPSVRELLERWHAGDRGALDQLLEQNLPWLREFVRARLGPKLRARAESGDFVQETVIDVLRYAPRFTVEDSAQFRGLLGRIVENNLRDANNWFSAKRRALSKETKLPEDTVLEIGRAGASVTTPSQAAERDESEHLMRLALELLDPEDRKVILLRQWEELSFTEVGQRLGIGEATARKRFSRALPRLAKTVETLAGGTFSGESTGGD